MTAVQVLKGLRIALASATARTGLKVMHPTLDIKEIINEDIFYILPHEFNIKLKNKDRFKSPASNRKPPANGKIFL